MKITTALRVCWLCEILHTKMVLDAGHSLREWLLVCLDLSTNYMFTCATPLKRKQQISKVCSPETIVEIFWWPTYDLLSRDQSSPPPPVKRGCICLLPIKHVTDELRCCWVWYIITTCSHLRCSFKKKASCCNFQTHKFCFWWNTTLKIWTDPVTIFEHKGDLNLFKHQKKVCFFLSKWIEYYTHIHVRVHA